jgi:sporulation protein YpjB
MRLVLLAVLTIILLSNQYPYIVHAADSSQQSNQQLVKISREIVQLSKQQEYEHALNLLQHFSEKFLQSDKLKNNLSMNELRLVSTEYSDARDALRNVSLDVDERVNVVLSFHLLIDALYSEHQPMWKNMESQIIVPIENMGTAVKKGNTESYKNAFNELKGRYEQLKPALEVDLDNATVSRLDSYISYLKKYEDILFSQQEETIQHINVMKEDFKILFDHGKKDSADLSLPWLIFSIGGIIISTLVYVGWIKFKAEREKIRKFNRES